MIENQAPWWYALSDRGLGGKNRTGGLMGGSDQDIETFLFQQLAARRGESESQVRVAALAEGGIDSLEGVELILAAEEKYGVEIPDDALSPVVCSSVSELAALIGSRMPR